MMAFDRWESGSATSIPGRVLPLPFFHGGHRDFSEEDLFQALRNRRRRYVLHYLKQQDAPVELDELVERVACWEYATTVEELTAAQRKRVYVSLLQVHLPTMDQASLVAYDESTGTVALTEGATGVEIYLERTPENDIDWGQFYLGIALFNAVLVAAVWIDLYPLSALPDATWFVFVVGMSALASLSHYLYNRRIRLGTDGPPPE